MNRKFIHYKWVEIATVSIITLIFVLGINLTAKGALDQYKIPDKDLYNAAFGSARNQEYLRAAMYLEAYIQRDPPMYTNNTNGHRTYVDKYLSTLIGSVISDQTLGKQVREELKKCKQFPCSITFPGSRGMMSSNPPLQVLEPPPDMAVVCEHINFQGRCIFLSVGTYNNPEQIGLPNDVISSVMVGSKVKLTLCLHGGLTGQCIPFTYNDNNLSNNSIDSQYNWNDNATSAQVSWR